jgi:four helix bundle protein
MPPYQELDAFKVCHELTLAIHQPLEVLKERDPELAGQLWQAALTASSRIARGAALQNRRMFAFCLNRSLSALCEIGYYLSLADGLNLLEPETCRKVEELRGRANFYVTKLLFSLIEPPKSD